MTFRSRVPLLSTLFFGLGLLTTHAVAQSSAALHGQALDASGKPLANAVIRLVSDKTAHGGRAWRYTLIGDALGKFRQEGLAPGAYLVMLFTDGKGTNVLRNVQLSAGGEQEIALSLTPRVP